MQIHPIRRATLALAAGAAVAVLIAGCSGSGGSTATSSGLPTKTLTIANSGQLVNFDPVNAVDGLLVVYYQPVFDTLIRKQPDGSLTPMLASKWSYNSGNTELTLTLRSGVKFSDGETFNADTAVANLKHQLAATTGPNYGAVAAIKSVEASGTDSVKIDLSTPDPGLLDALATTAGIMAAPKSLDAKDIGTNPIGTGPYTLDAAATISGNTYTYTANKNYWDKSLIKFGKIVIKTMTDATARLNAIKSGQVEGTPLDLTQNDTANAAGLTVQASRDDWLGFTIYDRDGKIVPALANVKVRQAIAYALDQKALVNAFRKGHADPTNQVFNKDSQAYVSSLDTTYSYDVSKAKQLLSEAGYANGFSVTIPDLSALFGADIFAAATDQLKAIGITVKLDSQPIPQLVQKSLSGGYAMAIAGGGMGSAWNTVYTYFLPNSLFNPMHSTTPEIANAIDKIRTTSGDAQKAAYQSLNTYVVQNAWALPLFRDDQIYATTNAVKADLQFGNLVPYIYNYTPAS